MNTEYIELHYVGGLELDLITIKKSAVISIQKPKLNTFGCIIQLDGGDKYPVKELYEDVVNMIGDYK